MSIVAKTAIKQAAGTTRAFVRLLACIRFDEVLVLNGSPLLGAILAMGNLTIEKAAAISLLAAGNCCLVAHVFLLNDWSGTHADLRDPNRGKVFTTNGVCPTEIGCLCLALGALSLLLLSPFGLQTLTIFLGIAGLSALYSAPRIHMKGVPLVNSVLHLAGGMMHFILGYSIFRAVEARGLAVACFFALTFMAGHLTHEVRDHDADLLNGIRTNAVRFGKRWTFVGGLATFTLAYILLAALAILGAVTWVLVFVMALYPFHLYWSLQALYAGLTFESVRLLQVRYRSLYAIIGLITVVAALLDPSRGSRPDLLHGFWRGTNGVILVQRLDPILGGTR